MKYIGVLMAVALLLAPLSASATCPDRHDYILWPGGYSVFFFDGCGSYSGSAGTGTMSCYGWSGDQIYYGSGSVDYSMTVPSDTSSGTHPWSVRIYVDFSDPYTYSLNGISASVIVRHNGSVTHSDSFFIHNGNQASMGCDMVNSSSFDASPGDSIEVSYGGVNYTAGTVMRMTPPMIFYEP
jgi:hypothetical protein